nr:hypothetical protein [Tanacetum cinerariifolium]
MSLSAEVRMRTEYNIKEKRRLKSVVNDQTKLLKVREKEIGDLRTQLLVKDAETAEAIRLREKGEFDVKAANLAASVKVRAAIGKAVEKGMQDGLSARITHGAEGRILTDVAAYNTYAEADCLFALQRLQSFNFSLIPELKSNKDARIDTIMNLLRLEDSL